MKVELIAWTEFKVPDVPWVPEIGKAIDDNGRLGVLGDGQDLIEFAGRACYESWGKPNPATAANDDYVKHIIEVGHFSVLEHASATFYVTEVSRSLTHEQVRHRHFGYSQRSQRYVDESYASKVVPSQADEVEAQVICDQFIAARNAYRFLYASARNRGVPVKEARGIARSVLPNATETQIVMTANLRAWRDWLNTRYVPGSPPVEIEIWGLAREILVQLKRLHPAVFADYTEV